MDSIELNDIEQQPDRIIDNQDKMCIGIDLAKGKDMTAYFDGTSWAWK